MFSQANILYSIFWLLCFCITMFGLRDCLVKYLNDGSYSNIDYVNFLTPKHPYPALTLCIENPYLKNKLQFLNPSNNANAQSSLQDKSMPYKIHYDEITLSEKNGGIQFQSSVVQKDNTRVDEIFQLKTNNIIRDNNMKCFTSDESKLQTTIKIWSIRSKDLFL